jgi:homoserine O-acetyltransferase
MSQTFYRIEADLTHMGYASLEDFLVGFWEGLFYTRDANDLLAMLWTWQNGDISANPIFRGDFKAALGAIRAKAILMPASTDLYFPPEDNAIEAAAMPNAELRVIETWWAISRAVPAPAPTISGPSTTRSRRCSRAEDAPAPDGVPAEAIRRWRAG